MLSAPTAPQLQALTNLSRQPEWGEVDKLLAAELAATIEKLLDSAEPAQVGKLQGRARLLRELQALITTAPTILAKLRGI